MSITTWDEFLPRMAPFLPGAPDFEVEDKLRDAAIEFLTRTRVWKVEGVELLTVVAGQSVYEVPDNATHTGIGHVFSAGVDGRPLGVAMPGEAPIRRSLDRATDDLSRCRVHLEGRARVRLTPAPNAGGGVVVATVAYVPTDAADGIPAFIYWEHREAIEKRAMAEMMMQPGKPWTNPAMAGVMLDRFEYLKNEAANQVGPIRDEGHRMRTRQWG